MEYGDWLRFELRLRVEDELMEDGICIRILALQKRAEEPKDQLEWVYVLLGTVSY